MIKPGYSSKIVAENIRALVKAGQPFNQAIRLSYNSARKCYFYRYPQGLLPVRLAMNGNRKAEHYTVTGAPIHRNPVDELDIPESEMASIRQDVKKQLSGKGADVRKAASLYTDFTGHDDPQLTKLKIPSMPKVALEVGLCDGILYTTIRDNKTEKYIHKFKSSSRPLLAASPDGKILLLLGGAFNFTDRGIVDD